MSNQTNSKHLERHTWKNLPQLTDHQKKKKVPNSLLDMNAAVVLNGGDMGEVDPIITLR